MRSNGERKLLTDNIIELKRSLISSSLLWPKSMDELSWSGYKRTVLNSFPSPIRNTDLTESKS